VLVQCLPQRGITDEASAAALLSGDALDHSPYAMPGMEPAVERILRAVSDGERIVVYGDFDADGVTATAVLMETLSALGGRAMSFIPHRERDGYGLSAATLQHLAGGGVDLVITVDCGIRAVDEVAWARGEGIDVVVTDHHAPPEDLPAAVAVVNPKVGGSTYPFDELSGVGVAFKLSQALARSVPGVDATELEESLLDLVAIGTVADVVPLVDENRALVKRGLRTLRRAERPGLRALLASANRQAEALTARDIAFVIAPRINAAGRMASAEMALELLLSRDANEAARLAEIVESYNRARREATAVALEQAEAELAGRVDRPFLLHTSPDVPLGITGLVAGRLSSRYNRPAAVLRRFDGLARGSARSIAEFNIIEALEQTADKLLRFGGHARAAGFTVREEDLSEVEQRVMEMAGEQLNGVDLRPRLDIDAEIEAHQLDWDLDDALSVLEPHGEGNRKPLLLVRDAPISGARRVGSDHMRFVIDRGPGAGSIDAIAFGQADRLERLGDRAAIVFTLDRNTWRGKSRLEANVEDVADPQAVEIVEGAGS